MYYWVSMLNGAYHSKSTIRATYCQYSQRMSEESNGWSKGAQGMSMTVWYLYAGWTLIALGALGRSTWAWQEEGVGLIQENVAESSNCEPPARWRSIIKGFASWKKTNGNQLATIRFGVARCIFWWVGSDITWSSLRTQDFEIHVLAAIPFRFHPITYVTLW